MAPTPELLALRDVCARLQSAGVAYMLTGSLALSFYARPRMTRDIDQDLILSKLEWSRDSRSEQQGADVRLLLETPVDRNYLDQWASTLGLDQLLKELEVE
jgi:hypothetical protein